VNKVYPGLDQEMISPFLPGIHTHISSEFITTLVHVPDADREKNAESVPSVASAAGINDVTGEAQGSKVSHSFIKPRFRLPFKPLVLAQTNGSVKPSGDESQDIEQVETAVMLTCSGDESQGIEQIKTVAIPVPSTEVEVPLTLAPVMVPQRPTLLQELEKTDSPVLRTVSVRTVSRKRTETTIKTLLFNVVLSMMGMLFAGVIVAIILFATYPIFKIAAFIVLLIALAHIISLQVEMIYRMGKQKFLTTTQLLRSVNKQAIPAEKDARGDIKHLKLIKKDTTTYLRALRGEDLKRDHRQ
jgi:hypothetical protein